MSEIPRTLERVQFAPGAKVFREGEPGSCAYLIEKGRIEISSINHGQKIVVSELGPGEMFGEMALIDNQKRSATATVLEHAEMIALDRAQFESKIQVADPVLHMLLRVVLKRFRWAMRKALSKERLHMTGETTNTGQTMLFDAARNEAIRQIRMEHDLNEALRDGQFALHYQPIVTTSDLKIAGFEALIRWNHPERGFLQPAEFISSAEDSRLIAPIGDWVMYQACADLARIHEAMPAGARRPFMTVNVSSRQIHHLAKSDKLAASIRVTGVQPEDIKLEFTESLLIESPELASQALNDIKKSGVHFAIDDFGTGYSSLSYLQRFPLDVLKIDRSFVASMVDDPDSRQIVKAIMGLSRGLGIEVVAEGIESKEALHMLTEMGCDFVQGFLMSRGVPIEEAIELMRGDKGYLALQTPDGKLLTSVS